MVDKYSIVTMEEKTEHSASSEESVVNSDIYDVAVVGAGVQGCSTAYFLAHKLGVKKVLLLEQFSVGHSHGSSGGQSRNTRFSYSEATYIAMVKEAHEMWHELEVGSDSQIYLSCGSLTFSSPGCKGFQAIVDNLVKHSIQHNVSSGTKVNQMYRGQLSMPSDYQCVYDDEGGILCASTAVQSYLRLFVSAGGELKEEHEVNEIVAGEVVSVRTNKGSFSTRRLVLTAGPWTNKLLQPTGLHLPLKVLRTEVLYWEVKSSEDFSPGKFPAFAWLEDANEDGICSYYGLPVMDYPDLLKICYHGGPEMDVDLARHECPPFTTVERTSQFISRFFRGVATTSPAREEPCWYTVTPDSHPILDKHPHHPNIVIGAGFSGHGFKLSPVVGKILSELCLGVEPSHSLSMFSACRFSEVVEESSCFGK